MTTTDSQGVLQASIRECWVDAANLRLSSAEPNWTDRPTIHAIVVESVAVSESHRRQGHFGRFLAKLCRDERFQMVVVECVQNPILASYLLRLGWECDPGVMDFYWRRAAT